MTIPIGLSRGAWRVLLLGGGLAWAAGACGNGEDGGTPSGSSGPGDVAAAGASSASPGDAGATETPEPPPGAPGDAGGEPGMQSTEVCTPGETRPCTLDLLCSGLATCAADGQGFGTCDCGSVPLVGTGVVGAACSSDADCSGGTRCMRADGNEYLGAGGPAGGYCTASCTGSADCQELDPDSECGPFGPDGSSICIRTCLSKAAEPGEAKCLNRANVECLSGAAAGTETFSAGRQRGFCFPRCGSDEECPAGRLCHRQAGICTDFPPPGSPIGSACDFDTDCDGRACEGDDANGIGTCTAYCVLGVLSGCGYGRNSSSRDAACLVPVAFGGGFSEGSGDRGYCLELCDIDSDCQQADRGFVCQPLPEVAAEFFGRPGACARGSAAN